VQIVYSINDVPIRLTEERWEHIISKAMTNFIKLPQRRMWLDYDHEADVLYLHFEASPTSTHSEMSDDGFIFDYRGSALVGVTILDASQRAV